MRIIILSIALLFCALTAHSQVLKSAGVWYFLDVDSMTARPAVLPNGTELAYVVGTKTVYYWNRNTSTWTAYGSTFNRDSINFDASIIGSGTIGDPWGVDSTLFATIAGVGDSIAAAVANYFPLQGGTLTGTGGLGFIGLPSQVSAPSTPASGLNIYAQGSSFNWKGIDGYERLFASTLTGGRTYTLPDVSGTFALGSGTTNRLPLWTATNTLGSSNIQDNGTAVSILNSKPFQLGQWTTAGRPTGVTGYMGYNTSVNGIEWYNGTRWAYALESTFDMGTATRIPFFDANGQITESSGFTFNNSSKILAINKSSPTYHVEIQSTGTINQKWIGLYNSAGFQQASFDSDGSGNGAIIVYNSSGVLQGRFSSGNASFLLGKMAFGAQIPGTSDFLVALRQTDIGYNVRVNIGSSGNGYPGVGYNMQFTASNNTYTRKSNDQCYFLDMGTSGRFSLKTAAAGATGSSITFAEPFSIVQSTNFIGINQTSPQRQLHVTGEARITDLTTDTPTRIVGADADGDLGAITVSTGLSLSGGNLTATGASTWLKTELEASRDVSISGGSSTDFNIQNTRVQLDGKTKIGSDSSFVHDPAQDTTTMKGTAVFGKQSSLGRQGVSGYQFTFRNPNTASTYVLIESGRTSPTGGEAALDFRSSGIWGSTIAYGTTTSKSLQFYNYNNSRVVMFLGSSGFVSGNSRTVIVGGSDDPIQWSGNGGLVVFDTITSGKALFLTKKQSSSSIPIAMFSSAANDRFTFNDDGTTRFHVYGTSATTASTLSKTESGYLASFATDGTVLSKADNTERYNNITSTTSPVTLSSTISDNLINQGSTQATFTLNMPASPVDGQVLYITYNNAITTLTIDGNGNTIVGSAVTTAVAGSQRKFKFYSGIGWIKQY